MKTIRVNHTTVYRYSCPVRFGEHRMMFRPRDSHDMDLIDTKMTISPKARVRWVHDVFGNSIAYATFASTASELRFESEILLQHFPYTPPAFQIDPSAEVYPFQYPADDMPDLMPSIMRRYPDGNKALEQWVKQFYDGRPIGTLELLSTLTHAIQSLFSYGPASRWARRCRGKPSPAARAPVATTPC